MFLDMAIKDVLNKCVESDYRCLDATFVMEKV